MTTGSRQVGALLVFLTLVGADSSHAQLRSLAAIKHLALESWAGAEQQTEALRTHDSLKNHQGLLVPTLDSVPTEGHPYFARCVVRVNLPKPLSVGLECYDAAGAYVETKRAANVDQLAFEVWRRSIRQPLTAATAYVPVHLCRAGLRQISGCRFPRQSIAEIAFHRYSKPRGACHASAGA